MNSVATPVRVLSSSPAAIAARARRAAAKAAPAPVASPVRTPAKIYDMPEAVAAPEAAVEAAPVAEKAPRAPRAPKFEKPTAHDFWAAELAVAKAELAYAEIGFRAHQLSDVAARRVERWVSKVEQLKSREPKN